MDTNLLLVQLRKTLDEQKIIQKHFQMRLNDELPSFKNSKFLKVLTKLKTLDANISRLEKSVKILQKMRRREIFVNLSSRVKLVSIDFEVTLWVDAKNISHLIGKRVGEIVELYNSQFRVEGIY